MTENAATTEAEKFEVDRMRIHPDDRGPKQVWWAPVYLVLWSDGSVTWQVDDD